MKVFRRFIKGILLKGESSDPTDNQEGSIWVNSSDNKIKSYLNSAIRALVSEDQTQTLTNKTIDADNNPISNLETDNLKAGVLVTDVSTATANTEIPSALAVKTALEAQNEADEITYDNTTSGLTATDVQAAVDEVEGRLDTAETGLSDHLSDAVDAHDASAISNVPAGNLAATDVQGALNELQTELDGAANKSLSNLNATAINQDFTINKAGNFTLKHDTVAGVGYDINIETPDQFLGAGNNSGSINILTGDRTNNNGLTGGITIETGQHTVNNDTLNGSGSLDLKTGDVTGGNSAPPTGNINIATGDKTGASVGGPTGNVSILSGSMPNVGGITAATGTITLGSGDNAYADGSSDTGLVTIKSGNASGGDSGDIDVETGTATGTRGNINLKANKVDMTSSTELDVTGVTVTGLSSSGDLWSDPVDADIVPDSTGNNRDLGSFSKYFNTANTNRLDLINGTRKLIFRASTLGTPSGDTVSSFIQLQTGVTFGLLGASESGPSTNSGRLVFETGNATGASSDSGDMSFVIGTAAQNQGEFKFIKSGDTVTVGDVWTASAADGSGYWSAPAGGGGATTELDNLGTVAFNADLIPDGNTRNIGGASAQINNFYVRQAQFYNTSGTPVGQMYTQALTTPSGATTELALIDNATAGTENLGIISLSNLGGDSSSIYVETGNVSTTDESGIINIQSGDMTSATNAPNRVTGPITLQTGDNSGTATSSNSGDINLVTGTVASGVRGGVVINANKLDASGVSEGVGLPIYKKVTVAASAFTAAATTEDIELLSLPAKAAIHSVVIKHTTAFSGGTASAVTLSVGISGTLDKYASAFDVFQATGDTVAQTTNVFDVENFGSATSIRLAATSTGDTLDNIGTGSVDVYVLMSTLP